MALDQNQRLDALIMGPESPVWSGTSCLNVGWRCTQYDGIVASTAVRFFSAAGVGSMIIGLLIAGIGFLLAGLLGIAYGIPIKEFSFGNTVIIAGAVTACTGMIIIALCVVVRELKAVAEHLNSAAALAPPRSTFPAPMSAGDVAPQTGSDDQLAGVAGRNPANPPRRRLGTRKPPRGIVRATRHRRYHQKKRRPRRSARNLLFTSTSRKERERAEGARDRACGIRRSAGRRTADPARQAQRTSARDIRGRLAAIGPRKDRGSVAPSAPRTPPVLGGTECCSRSPGAAQPARRAAGGDGAQIGRRRWHGVLAVFGRLDRGADARGHDALWLDR